jgi:predicted HTH transcriptional regulator
MKELTEEYIEQILSGNSENLNLEFKGSFDFISNIWAREKLIRAILAMSNTRNGGYIVVGIEQKDDKSVDFSGIEAGHLTIFKSKEEDLKSKVESFSSSPVNYEISYGRFQNKDFILINVSEFNLSFIICKKKGDHKTDKILEEGSIYVRTLKDKPSSVKLIDPDDIQDLFKRAVDKQIVDLHSRGWNHKTETIVDQDALFGKERSDFFKE